MYTKGKVVCIVLMLMFVFTLGAEGDIKYASGSTVEKIYERIRQAGPVYDWTEETVSFQNEGMNMVCTLVVPQTEERPPIVITMNGFAEDRFYKEVPGTDGEWYYPRLSRILAEQGFATLRIDYRGSGDSDGDYPMTTFSTQISDAVAAANFVRTHLRYRVKPWSLGLLGHSQGGLVASVASTLIPRVESVCIWSAVASPPITYAGLITMDSIRQGVALPDGGNLQVSIQVGDYYYGEITLGKGFFQDLFQVDPVAHIRDYQGPLMYVGGLKDIIVWPQPTPGQMFMDNHNGFEKLVMLNGDHEFDSDFGYEIYDECLYWTAAWFIKTLE